MKILVIVFLCFHKKKRNVLVSGEREEKQREEKKE